MTENKTNIKDLDLKLKVSSDTGQINEYQTPI